jgi:hypothetical protein
MAELELETIDRAVRWCAEAGRQATASEVRLALAPLGWDQLLSVRALLADPPPARPLGPWALADLARGVPADVAAERERDARYPRPDTTASQVPAAPAVAPAPAEPRKKAGKSARRQVVVRKAKPASAEQAPDAPRLPLIEELLLPAGRGELARLVRRHGGRRPVLAAALAATYRRADGAPVGSADLDAALEHHGLERAFLRRERDELFHAVRAAKGVLAKAATDLGHDLASLGLAIGRLGLDADVKRLREARRRDLRSKATLSELAQLWVGSGDALADLELLDEVEKDLKKRLPEHLRALATTREPLEQGLVRTLALPATTVRDLLTRLGIDLSAPVSPAAPVARPPRPARPATPDTRRTPPAAPPSRAGERPPLRRPAGARPSGARPTGARPSGARPPGARPPGARPSGARPYDARPTGPRPPGARPYGSRPSGPRMPGARPSGPRAPGARPSGPRRPGAPSSGPRRPSPGGGRRGPAR